MKRILAAPLLLFAWSCSPSAEPSRSSAAPPSTSSLPPGIVASVGPLAISAASVATVSRVQELEPREALEREIHDALFANGALYEGLDQQPPGRAALRGTLARALLESLKGEAALTEPTDDEVAEATARHFVELDRPESFRVIHAVVRISHNSDTAQMARAQSLAERIAERVAKSGDEAEFRTAAESLAREGLEVVVETLPPVAADGRVVDLQHPAQDQSFALPFARAASRLTHAGQKSGVVATEFGYHTMMLLERLPSRVIPLEERRRLLRDEILADRARKSKIELLAHLKSTLVTSVERSADVLLRTVDVAQHDLR